jgi:hypothetical protein
VDIKKLSMFIGVNRALYLNLFMGVYSTRKHPSLIRGVFKKVYIDV